MSGSPVGYASAGLNAAHLAAANGAFGSATGNINMGVGLGGDVLGLYSGLKQGGVQGYGTAALDAAQLGTHAAAAAGSSTAASVAPMLSGLATGVGALAAWYGASQYLASKGRNLDEYMNANDYKQMGDALAAGPGNTPESQMAYYNAQAQLAAEYTQTGGARMPFSQAQLDAWGIPQMAYGYDTYTPTGNLTTGGSRRVAGGYGMGQGNTSGHQL